MSKYNIILVCVGSSGIGTIHSLHFIAKIIKTKVVKNYTNYDKNNAMATINNIIYCSIGHRQSIPSISRGKLTFNINVSSP